MSVVPLHGGTLVRHTTQPDEDTVQELEMLLSMAKSGEIQGIAFSLIHSDGSGSWGQAGFVVGYTTIGALAVLMNALASQQEQKCELRDE